LLNLNDRGRIETGYRGDLLALGADPTKDLGALRDIKYVISAGNLVAR
jgi:imidazolonepropionase-like amidohydrolase